MEREVLWRDKKRPLFGKPLSFTEYSLYPDRLVVRSGLLRERTDILMLYRVLDVSMSQSIIDKLFHVGTVIVSSADKSAPNMVLALVANPDHVMDLLSEQVEKVRETKGIRPHEFINN